VNILITNDDGIHAEGLWVLARAMRPLGMVTVVAPDREQSGVGTALTLGRHIRVHTIHSPLEDVRGYAVEGTPGDAVVLALHALVDAPIDAVVSGINLGSNVGNDTVISGTVGAALQGFFNGIFSVAVSLGSLRDPHWDLPARLAQEVVRGRAAGELPDDIFLNLNTPNVPIPLCNGFVVRPLGEHSYLDAVEEHVNKKGHRSYLLTRGQPAERIEEGTDIWALRSDYAVLTPMRRELQGDARWLALEAFAERTWAKVLRDA
jgi:5'-nucleotidase